MTSIANPAAQAQAALHRTELLLDSCRNGPAAPSTPSTLQQRWHAEQQTQFLTWLDAGGFAQIAPDKENSGTEPLFSVPQRDLNEESKFSLVRIDDAVE